jgi:hypothetical protein
LIVDAQWLTRHGYSTSLRSQYLAAGWLVQPTRGVYRRPLGSLSWQQVAVSLQTLLARPLVVGGRTALEQQGFAHFLVHETKKVHLYGPKHPPSWLNKLGLTTRFVYHNDLKLFRGELIMPRLAHLNFNRDASKSERSGAAHAGLVVQPWGQWDWPLTLSSPERAVLELLDEQPNHESFHQADMLMQGLTNLSPRRLQKLLVDCRSVKVKRLFLYFADRHQHAWLKHLKKDQIDLGQGKRMLVKGGKLNPTYQITVPEELDAVR